MAGFEREVRKILTEAGCSRRRTGKGDHEIWWCPLSRRHSAVDGKIKQRHTANETLKQAGLEKRF